MKIYTRTGDDGTTSLAGGGRVPKYHMRVEAYGSVDELIAWIGLLRGFPATSDKNKILIHVQDQLMRCACILAQSGKDPEPAVCLPEEQVVKLLEDEIDEMEASLPPLKSFILPGGNLLVSYCNVARCVCRRAERSVLRLRAEEQVPEIICRFLNRLSDYLFVLTRNLSFKLDIEQVKWPAR
jgi:cob(I)alamin adenosyltransferase